MRSTKLYPSWQVAGLDRQPAGQVDLAVLADVTDGDAVATAVARVEAELGPIDALVNTAGHYEMAPFLEITPAQLETMVRVHVGGLFALCRAVVPGMLARGSGAVVAVSSELSLGGGDGEAHYAAAKGAVNGLVRSLAAELGPHGIRVNGVAPGPTDTPLLAPDSPWREPAYLATLPARRLATPEEIAVVVGYLVTEAAYTVGEIISPNSGAVI